MSILPAPFHNSREFRATFVRRLGHVLIHEDIGEFILVLANASYDEELYHLLKQRLAKRYHQIVKEFDALLEQTETASDDMLVFQMLLEIGFENLYITCFKNAGPWMVQYNQLRSLRPARMSGAAVAGVRLPFDEDRFHFNKPFLKNERVWSGDLMGSQVDLFFNKFPFAELHGLLVVNRLEKKPQYIETPDHEYIWRLTEAMGAVMPGVGFGYNAYGAYSSINHQHYHMFVWDDGQYPIESASWSHNGGDKKYPVDCKVFENRLEAANAINDSHANGISYNLLYRPGKLYFVARAKQGSYQHNDWTSGFAWAEIVGSVTTFSEIDFNRLNQDMIETEFTKIHLS